MRLKLNHISIFIGTLLCASLFLLYSLFLIRNPPVTQNYPFKAQKLIIVPCHAPFFGYTKESIYNPDKWGLQSYQKDNGHIKTFVEHIKEGIRLLNSEPDTLLVFSGGQTNQKAGSLSEASGYLMIARLLNNENVDRIITEDFAMDSYQNLAFSICRFQELTGHLPSFVTVIGFGFKERRFRELHLTSIAFNEKSFKYIGIDPQDVLVSDDPELAQWKLNQPLALEGENHTFHLFKSGPCETSLVHKRTSRNVFSRFHGMIGYPPACPDVKFPC